MKLHWFPIALAPRDGTPVMGYFPRVMAGVNIRPIRWSGWGGGVWACAATGYNLDPDGHPYGPTYFALMPKGPDDPEEDME